MCNCKYSTIAKRQTKIKTKEQKKMSAVHQRANRSVITGDSLSSGGSTIYAPPPPQKRELII